MNNSKRNDSFSVKDMIVLTTIIAFSLAPLPAFGNEGIVFSIFLFTGSLMIWFRKYRLFGWSMVLLFLVAALMPSTGIPRHVVRRSTCQNNLKQLSLASINYSSKHRHYPPPYSIDENGNRLHSWRVLLLPYLDEQDLYDDLDLTKPWDHPDNLKHAHRMPEIFKCPSYRPGPNDTFPNVMTSYVAIVGNQTVWNPNANGIPSSAIKDGMSNTALIVESDSKRVHWMSPLDVRFEEIVPLDTSGRTNLLSSHHRDGTNISFCDGHICFMDGDMPADIIKALTTINGREIASPDDW